MSTSSISRRLSRWVAALAYSDLPSEVLDRARGVTLQGVSSCLLGHDFPETMQAIRLVEEEELGCGGTTTALVDGRRFARAGAAFINSEMMFAGGKWDTFRMVVHPSCAVLPAALMAAEATRCSGREFLTGVWPATRSWNDWGRIRPYHLGAGISRWCRAQHLRGRSCCRQDHGPRCRTGSRRTRPMREPGCG